MAREAREVHTPHERVRVERARDRVGVLGVPLHPQLERLEAAQREPAVER